MFVGRKYELEQLCALSNKATASLAVLKGRRRIGKSSLVQEFAKDFDTYLEFQGLAPREKQSNKDQLDNFAQQLGSQLNVPQLGLANWNVAFELLAKLSDQGDKRVLILLDEISWLAAHDPDFVGQLKIAWDTKFKKNKKLVLVLCGSVSSWIEKNIIRETDFVGRISLNLNLEELYLDECAKFWSSGAQIVSPIEILKVLSVTGGVPRYLEEINPKESAERNIKRLCFDPSSVLFNEFDIIFNDIFSTRAKIYRDIVLQLKNRNLGAKEIAEALGQGQNGDLTEYLHDLQLAGFISRDYLWDLKGKAKSLSKYRIKDNYLRFYLKYIFPNKDKIEKGLYEFRSLSSLLNWDSIVGLQFENLVLHNIKKIIELLSIDTDDLVNAAPFVQTKTKQRDACQIDLLILCKYNSIYLCEVKFREKIGSEVIQEVQRKIERLKKPKNVSVRPVLIYAGTLSDALEKSSFFTETIDVSELL